jgi:hypothetical protein
VTWNVFTCPSCLRRFGGPSFATAIRRFYTHPRHDCVASSKALDVIAGNVGPYTNIGGKR